MRLEFDAGGAAAAPARLVARDCVSSSSTGWEQGRRQEHGGRIDGRAAAASTAWTTRATESARRRIRTTRRSRRFSETYRTRQGGPERVPRRDPPSVAARHRPAVSAPPGARLRRLADALACAQWLPAAGVGASATRRSPPGSGSRIGADLRRVEVDPDDDRRLRVRRLRDGDEPARPLRDRARFRHWGKPNTKSLRASLPQPRAAAASRT